MCVKAKKNKRDFFFSRETYTRIIVIWFDNSAIDSEFVSWFFPSRKKGFPCKFCVLVCDCYFRLLILLIILFGTQQVVSELRLKWKQWPKKKARLQELKILMEQTLGIRGCRLKIISMGKIASTSFGDETWNYERWRLEPSW